MLNQKIKTSPHGNFQVKQLSQNVAICEAKVDRHDWGNATETEPAFLVYFGCRKDQVAGYIKDFNTFYRCYWCEVRKPKYLKGFEAEIKIRGMQRYADTHAFGLDYFLESQQQREFGCDLDEYLYYASGVEQHF